MPQEELCAHVLRVVEEFLRLIILDYLASGKNRSYDSFVPRPIGELAEETMVEGSRDGIQRRKWEPYQNAVSAQPVEARTRNSGLRGVRVAETEDDAVTHDRVTSARMAARSKPRR